ncbi:hypothetical protein BB558_005013 [Smittium angustum]|uniref:Chromatin-remodeling ATPase INO80 n=1 Tax=Smittium angustum TaxID=133377 RepID=A0A2U1J1N4_SMIAN|nr:hypothetical protein BB558_005013 [Smittium angustum]
MNRDYSSGYPDDGSSNYYNSREKSYNHSYDTSRDHTHDPEHTNSIPHNNRFEYKDTRTFEHDSSNVHYQHNSGRINQPELLENNADWRTRVYSNKESDHRDSTRSSQTNYNQLHRFSSAARPYTRDEHLNFSHNYDETDPIYNSESEQRIKNVRKNFEFDSSARSYPHHLPYEEFRTIPPIKSPSQGPSHKVDYGISPNSYTQIPEYKPQITNSVDFYKEGHDFNPRNRMDPIASSMYRSGGYPQGPDYQSPIIGYQSNPNREYSSASIGYGHTDHDYERVNSAYVENRVLNRNRDHTSPSTYTTPENPYFRTPSARDRDDRSYFKTPAIYPEINTERVSNYGNVSHPDYYEQNSSKSIEKDNRASYPDLKRNTSEKYSHENSQKNYTSLTRGYGSDMNSDSSLSKSDINDPSNIRKDREWHRRSNKSQPENSSYAHEIASPDKTSSHLRGHIDTISNIASNTTFSPRSQSNSNKRGPLLGHFEQPASSRSADYEKYYDNPTSQIKRGTEIHHLEEAAIGLLGMNNNQNKSLKKQGVISRVSISNLLAENNRNTTYQNEINQTQLETVDEATGTDFSYNRGSFDDAYTHPSLRSSTSNLKTQHSGHEYHNNNGIYHTDTYDTTDGGVGHYHETGKLFSPYKHSDREPNQHFKNNNQYPRMYTRSPKMSINTNRFDTDRNDNHSIPEASQQHTKRKPEHSRDYPYTEVNDIGAKRYKIDHNNIRESSKATLLKDNQDLPEKRYAIQSIKLQHSQIPSISSIGYNRAYISEEINNAVNDRNTNPEQHDWKTEKLYKGATFTPQKPSIKGSKNKPENLNFKTGSLNISHGIKNSHNDYQNQDDYDLSKGSTERRHQNNYSDTIKSFGIHTTRNHRNQETENLSDSSVLDKNASLESYKKYLHVRARLAIMTYERKSRRKRKSYNAKFMEKFKKRIPKRILDSNSLFSTKRSDFNVFRGFDSDESSEFMDTNNKSNRNKGFYPRDAYHISEKRDVPDTKLVNTSRNYMDHHINNSDSNEDYIYAKLMDKFRNGNNHDFQTPSFKQHLLGSGFVSSFNHSSDESQSEKFFSKKDYFSHSLSERNKNKGNRDSPNMNKHENAHYSGRNSKSSNITLRFGHLQRQIRENIEAINSRKSKRSNGYPNFDGYGSGSSADSNFDSNVVPEDYFDKGSEFSSNVGSQVDLTKYRHQALGNYHHKSALSGREHDHTKKTDLEIWKEKFKVAVCDEIPKVYKQFHSCINGRQYNLRRVALLCQRECRRVYGPVTLRGGPLNTLGDNRAPKEVMIKARRSIRETLFFWKRHEKEEREARKRAEKEALEKIKLEEEAREATRQSRKLNFLITQTELYSHFVGEKIKGEVKSEDKSHMNDKEALEELDFYNATDETIKEHATRGAQMALALQQEKTKEFDIVRSDNIEVSNAVDAMNFQEPSTLGGSGETPQPRMLMCQLKEYQLKGLHWLASLYEQGINGILADEMGLGKTVQSISLMAYLAETHGIWGPFMVVAPASTLHNWQQEIARFAPELKILPYWGTQKDRKILRKSFWNVKQLGRRESSFHILVTSYQLVITDEPVLNRVKWQYMVLDEAQAIKSSTSARWKTLLQFRCRNRLLLTGTPIQNSMQELWALLHFIMPSLFDSHEEFSEWFSRDIEAHAENNSSLNSHQLKRLHMILKPFMLRRIKKHVQHELGEKVEHFVYCGLTHRQAQMYSGLMRKISITDLLTRLQSSSGIGGDTDENLMNLVMQFRKVCNHPELFERAEVESPFAFSNASVSALNRPGSQLLYTPTKSLISFSIPKLLVDMQTSLESKYSLLSRPNPQVVSNLDNAIGLQSFSLWLPHKVFDYNDKNNTFLALLRLCGRSMPLIFNTLLRNEMGFSNWLDEVERYNNRCCDIKSYLTLCETTNENIVENKLSWNQSGLGFVYYTSKIMGIKHDLFKNLGLLLSISKDEYFYNSSQDITPAYKNTVVALPPNLVCSENSFYNKMDSLLLNHPLRMRIQPSIMNFYINDITKPKLFVNPTPKVNSIDFTKPFLKQGRSSIWTPSVDKLIRYSGKMAVLDPLLTKLKADGHRVLIYFQMTKMIDLMEEYLAYRQHTYLRLDGSSKISDRRNMVMDWQTRPEIFIFLLSTRAGGLGINLTAADTVIFYDSDWNPTVDQQAMDRAHRLGQTKQVTVYRLITQGTIEERILERARQKDHIHKIVIAGGDTNSSSNPLQNGTGQNDEQLVNIEGEDYGKEDLNVDDKEDIEANDENAENSDSTDLKASNKPQKKLGRPMKQDKLIKTIGSTIKPNNFESEYDGAFSSTMMDLKPNDIVSLLLDEASGNDDKLWTEKLQKARNQNSMTIEYFSGLPQSYNSNTPDVIEDQHVFSGIPTPRGVPVGGDNLNMASMKTVASNTMTPAKLSGSADHLFDGYFASLELQNQINKMKSNGKGVKRQRGKQTRQTSKAKKSFKQKTPTGDSVQKTPAEEPPQQPQTTNNEMEKDIKENLVDNLENPSQPGIENSPQVLGNDGDKSLKSSVTTMAASDKTESVLDSNSK